MKTRLVLLFFLPLSVIGQTDMAQRLERFMQAQVSVNGFVGTVLVVSHNKVLLKKAYGWADYEWKTPTTPDTKYSLASVSKQFTAAAILQLMDKGKLSLSDPLSRYFPGYPKGDSVTIHMMLTHSAGLPPDFDELYVDQTGVTRDSAIAQIMRKPYLFSPGSDVQYSNIGYFLLACIIEKVSGIGYGAYMQQYIFRPAGMVHSGVTGRDTILSQRARSYHHTASGLANDPYINWELNRGHDGIYSTAEDLYRWHLALYGTKILSETARQKMFTSYNKGNFGYGLLINPMYNHQHELIAHDGGFLGAMTSLNWFPRDSLFVTVLSNNESPAYMVAYSLSAIVFGIRVTLPYKHIPIQMDTAVYSSYMGKYGRVVISKDSGRLWYNTDIELLPETPTKFFRTDNPDRTVEFVRDKDGKISSLILTNGGVEEKLGRER